MRFICLLFALLTFSLHALADCSSSGLYASPDRGSILQNSWIILEGYAYSQKVILKLNKKYPIYLESKNHKVKLNVKEVYQSQFSLTQALLSPDELLHAGSTYTLRIDNLDESEQYLLNRWNSETREREPITWTVTEGTDATAPQWLGNPEYLEGSIQFFGCGPVMHATFSLPASDDSHLFVKTEVTSLKDNSSAIYYLPLGSDHRLNVGHQMCSGAFDFEQDTRYKIRFSLMDLAGNTDPQWTEWIEFDSPFEGIRR